MLKEIHNWMVQLSHSGFVHSVGELWQRFVSGSMPHIFRMVSYSFLDIAHPHFGLLLGVAGFLLAAGSVVFTIWQRKTFRNYEDQLTYLQELLQGLRAGNKLEENLTRVLEAVGKLIPAPYLACYVMDEQSNQFVLRTVTHPFDEFSAVGPSYSGLALPNREAYVPPMTFEDPGSEHTVYHGREGILHTITFVTPEHFVLIHMVTIDKLSERVERKATDLLREVEGTLDDLVHHERERIRSQLVAYADTAVRQVAAVAIDPQGAIEILMQSFNGMVGGYGGLYVEDEPVDGTGVYGVGAAAEVAGILGSDMDTISLLRRMIGERHYQIITRNDAEFYKLPGYLSSLEIGAVGLIRVPQRGVLVFLYDKTFDAERSQSLGRGQLRVLSMLMQKVTVDYERQREVSRSNARMLTNLVEMVDNLNPHTVGYSEQVMRYALSIGRQIGISGQELLDLGLAARLSNIGVIGLNRNLMTKEGRYTEFEFESMKLHSEIGASMITLATGNRRAASFVLYHHERVDGYGYPYGLKLGEIPLGARIIYVVQVFLAKVNGRAWRDPVTFQEAIAALRKVAGTQLDSGVVDAFINWITQVERHADVQGKPLGRCHDILSVPSSICESCLVFSQPEVAKCWDFGDNQCAAHGRECSTCLVRTEYIYRQRHFKRQVQ